MHGNALLRVNRQLHRDTLALIEDTLRPGKVEIPFVLDVMVIKGVGILPTWISFPFMPDRIHTLHINVRIVRPGRDVPLDWVRAGYFERQDRFNSSGHRYDYWGDDVCKWNFVIVFLLYAMGQLTGSPSPKRQDGPKYADQRHDKSPVSPDTEYLDMYLSENVPYIVDEIFFDWTFCEYTTAGEVLPPYSPDEWSIKGYDPEEHVSFGRTIFNYEPKFLPEQTYDEEILQAGKWPSCVLMHTMYKTLNDIQQEPGTELLLYHRKLGENIGILKQREENGIEQVILGNRRTSSQKGWVYHLADMCRPYVIDFGDIEGEIETEKQFAQPSVKLLRHMEMAKRRMDCGWWDEVEYEWYKAVRASVG